MANNFPSVGIIGSGPVGTGTATLLTRAGYPVTLGTRNPAAKRLSESAPLDVGGALYGRMFTAAGMRAAPRETRRTGRHAAGSH